MDNSEIRKRSSTVRRKFKFEFVLVLLVAILAVFVDRMFAGFFLRSSADISAQLQTIPLYQVSRFFSVAIFGGLFLTVFVLFIVQPTIEKNLIMMFGVFLLIYAQALLKLMFADGRPIFFSPTLPTETCICDYGKPSGHALCSAGLLLFIFDNLKTNYQLPPWGWTALKTCFWGLFLCISFSRVYLGAHSYNQIILGGIFGLLIFILMGRYEDPFMRQVVIPITVKEKLRDQKSIYVLIAMAVFMNYLLLFFWSHRRHFFENLDNDFYDFLNCHECLFEGKAQFSNKIIADALNFNTIFGIFWGAYLFADKGTYWVGFSGKASHLLARIGLLIVFLLPMSAAGLLRTRLIYFEIGKNISCSVLTGFLISNTLAKFSIWLETPQDGPEHALLLAEDPTGKELENKL